MEAMHTAYKIAICIGGLIVLSFSRIAVAQSTGCAACGSSPEPLQAYTMMATQILSAIQTQSPEGPTVGAYNVPGLFQGGVLQLEDEARDAMTRAADAAARSISIQMQASMAVSTVLFSNVRDISRDTLMGFALFAQNQAIVRDRAKLQQIGSRIQDKIFELALANARLQRLSQEDKEQIQTILQEYQQQGLVGAFILDEEVTYVNIMHVLQNINRAFERHLAYGSIEQFNQRTFSAGGGSFAIRLNYQQMQDMKEAYACVRFGDQCAGNFKQFVTDIQTITSENVQAVQTAGADIADASRKLKDVFNIFGKQTANFFRTRENKRSFTEEEKQALSRQEQLLRTLYGADFKRFETIILPTIRANISSESFEQIADNLTSIGRNAQSAIVDPFRNIDRPSDTIVVTPIAVELPDGMADMLTQTMKQVHQHNQNTATMAKSIDPTHMLVYVPLLAEQLDTVRTIIGTKDTRGMLIHNLGTACELQCTNAGGTCRW